MSDFREVHIYVQNPNYMHDCTEVDKSALVSIFMQPSEAGQPKASAILSPVWIRIEMTMRDLRVRLSKCDDRFSNILSDRSLSLNH
jgi:hypothetical protein